MLKLFKIRDGHNKSLTFQLQNGQLGLFFVLSECYYFPTRPVQSINRNAVASYIVYTIKIWFVCIM